MLSVNALGRLMAAVAAVAIAVGRIGDEDRALIVAVGFRRIVDGMRPGVRSVDQQAPREAVLIIHDQRVVRTVVADVLQSDVVVQRVGPRGCARGSIDGAAVGEEADRVDQVDIAKELEIPSARIGITNGKRVVAGQLPRDLNAGVDGVCRP